MSVVKWSAAIVAFALVLHSGCDLWCHYAEEMASTSQSQSTATPPCHDANHSDNSKNRQPSGRDHERPTSCLPLQAADDGSKMASKVAVANLPATVAVTLVHDNLREQTLSFIAFTPIGLSSSDHPLFVLRI